MIKKILSAMLSAIIFAACFGCSPSEPKSAAVVWTMPNTEKILLDKTYDNAIKENNTVEISMAKGEYESGQVLITANKDISSIDLEVTDLVSGENKISKENIKVYFQKYIDIQVMSSPKAPELFGFWPDALVPLYAIQNKSEDKIKTGNNQGLWITVNTPKDIKGGTYSANFVLKLNGESFVVPVNVEVWDFVVPTGHQKTTFNNFREDLFGGELDNTMEMMEIYYDYFLDYRISVYELPMLDGTAETYVKQAKKYAADERCNAYNMEYSYHFETVVMDGVINKYILETEWDKVEERLLLLARESEPGLNLFEKLYFWDQSTDEPDGGLDRIAEANYKQARFNDLLLKVVKKLDAENFDYGAHGIERNDILYLENVVTAKESSKLPNITSFCPMINDFDKEERREVYEKLKEDDPRKTTWWYDAWIPQYPYPNYRIEESSLGSRVMGWMQKDYDIAGLLYWGTSVYVQQGVPGGPKPRDPYNDPYSFQAITMDGCLTYPGRPYDIMGPVGSIRLESIRDGLEDYEYLWLLEDLLIKAEETYGVSFDYDKIMRTIYDSLYTGVIPNNNSNNLFAARREVAAMIELLNSDAKGAIVIDKVDAAENKTHMTVYTAKGVSVKADGKELTSETSHDGLKFSFVKELTEKTNFVKFEFTMGGKSFTINKNVGNKSYMFKLSNGSEINITASNGHASDMKDHIVLTKNTDNNEVSSEAIKIAVSKYETDNEMAQIVYNPEVYLSKAKFFSDVSAADMDKIKFTVYNGSSVNKKLSINLYSGISESRLQEFTLKPGLNQIEFNQVYLSNWSFLSKTDKISIRFEKCENSAADIYYIDNAFYTVKEA